jgi:hypothetical protein
MHTGQHYFSKEKLKDLLVKFDTEEIRTKLGAKELKGFVFTAGRTEDGNACSYAFPVYSMADPITEGDTIIYQNTDPTTKGCPYPPQCL